MAILVVTIIVLGALLVGSLALYGHEVLRMANVLHERSEASNQRMTVEVPLPGCAELARATNGLLDEMAQRELRQKMEEEDLLAGLAGLSHDIRTPLAGAKGYLQLAQEAVDPAEVARCTALAEQRLDAMEVMLDQLFDYTRAINPQVELHEDEADVIGILATVLAGNYPAFQERGWEPVIEVGEQPLMDLVDPQAMERIFENIIANMLKHGDGGVVIQREGRTITFANALAPEVALDEDRLFERFYRGDDARRLPGAGLGLPVVKRLCDAMGIGVRAEVSDGRFTLSLAFA